MPIERKEGSWVVWTLEPDRQYATMKRMQIQEGESVLI